MIPQNSGRDGSKPTLDSGRHKMCRPAELLLQMFAKESHGFTDRFRKVPRVVSECVSVRSFNLFKNRRSASATIEGVYFYGLFERYDRIGPAVQEQQWCGPTTHVRNPTCSVAACSVVPIARARPEGVRIFVCGA
jgi:hypothetical protein